jgi:hypothetical protein
LDKTLKKIIINVLEEDKLKLEKIYEELNKLEGECNGVFEKIDEVVTKSIIKGKFFENIDMEKKVSHILEINNNIKSNFLLISKYFEIDSEKISSVEKEIQKVIILLILDFK